MTVLNGKTQLFICCGLMCLDDVSVGRIERVSQEGQKGFFVFVCVPFLWKHKKYMSVGQRGRRPEEIDVFEYR